MLCTGLYLCFCCWFYLLLASGILAIQSGFLLDISFLLREEMSVFHVLVSKTASCLSSVKLHHPALALFRVSEICATLALGMAIAAVCCRMSSWFQGLVLRLVLSGGRTRRK